MAIVLASASPRRRELLEAAGITCEVRPVDVDESRLADESGEAYVARVAALKADTAAARWPGDVIIAADTTVLVGPQVLAKPESVADAAAMLRALSGRTHDVLTAVVIARPGGREAFVERTAVTFRALDLLEVDWYVQSGEPMDKAGGYAIQGKGSRFVTGIQGSYSNVVGLPVAQVVQALMRLGISGDWDVR